MRTSRVIATAVILATIVLVGMVPAGSVAVAGSTVNSRQTVHAVRTARPVANASLQWISVSTGPQFTLAIKADRTLWAWGDNTYGELGDGSTVFHAFPEQIGTDTDWSQVSAGPNFVVALKTDGTLWTWGRNGEGELGDGTTTNHLTPEHIGIGSDWVYVSAGDSFCCVSGEVPGHAAAISSNGTLWAWGFNADGELGDGGTTNSLSPVMVGGNSNWAQVASGDAYTMAITTDHTLWAWGSNYGGDLGDGTTNSSQTTPEQIGSDTNWAQVAVTASVCGCVVGHGNHTAAVKTDGTLWTWGSNYSGELGDGTFTDHNTPEQVGSANDWAQVSVDDATAAIFDDGGDTFGIRTDGSLWGWGSDYAGTLGDGTSGVDYLTPILVGGAHWSALSASADHAMGFQSDGSLWAWGRPNLGTCCGDSSTPQPVAYFSASETLGGGNPGDNQTTCSGCPINTATGEFHEGFSDLSVPGRGIPLNLTRTYSSLLKSQDSPFGFGWANSYGMSTTVDQVSGGVTVNQSNGSSVTFLPNGSGGYVGPSTDFAKLTLDSSTGDYTYARTTGNSYVFNGSGQLIKELDRNGYTTSLAYGRGGLTTVTDPAGRKLTFTYGSNGLVASVTDPGGRKVTYSYDSSNNLTGVTDAANGTWTFTYDTSHNMLTATDPRGGTSTLVYDSSNRVSSWTDPMNRTTTYGYSGPIGGAETTTETDPLGNVTDWTYQSLELVSKTEGAGTSSAATTSYGFDPATMGVSSVTDPDGHVTTSTYDAAGNLLATTDPLGRTKSFTYNSLGEVLTATDGKGVTTTNSYDSHGNLLSTSIPIGNSTATTTFTYNPSNPGDVASMTNPDGKTWTYAYDKYGNQSTSTDPLGNVTTDKFNVLSQKTQEKSPLGHKTSYAYDQLGDVLTVTDPLKHVTTKTYDADQNLITSTDAKGDLTTKTYDADNELTSTVTKSSANVTTSSQSSAYDAAGNVASQTNGVGQTTTYAYDPLNRRISSSDPRGRTTTFTYDSAGNLLTATDPAGRTTSVVYDADNEPTSASYSDGVTPNVSYAYDADGQRISMSDGTGTTTYSYDALHRLTADSQGGGQSVSYAYDLAGNLTSLSYPGGNTVTRTYDSANRMTAVTDWLSHTTTFAYDKDGNFTTESYPNGITGSYKYDKNDQITKIKDKAGSTTVFKLTDTRDALGQVTVEGSVSYGYDASNRLASSSVGPSPLSYDQAGELTQAGTATNTYDAASELTSSSSSSGATSYTYDSLGDRTSATPPTGPSSTYGYDQVGRLVSFSQGGTTASYAYNGDGLRMSKTVNATVSPFVWDLAGKQPLILLDGTASYVTGPGGLPIEQVTGATVDYLLHDQLGSTRLVSDANGNVAGTYSYDPYGSTTHTGKAGSPFEFGGQYTDGESGLQYLRARYYEASSAQFLTLDPLEAVTGNPYSYASDDPVNQADPSGQIDQSQLSQDQIDQVNRQCASWQHKDLCTAAAFCAEPTYGIGSYSGPSCTSVEQLAMSDIRTVSNALAANPCGNVLLEGGYIASHAEAERDLVEGQIAYQTAAESLNWYNGDNACKNNAAREGVAVAVAGLIAGPAAVEGGAAGLGYVQTYGGLFAAGTAINAYNSPTNPAIGQAASGIPSALKSPLEACSG